MLLYFWSLQLVFMLLSLHTNQTALGEEWVLIPRTLFSMHVLVRIQL